MPVKVLMSYNEKYLLDKAKAHNVELVCLLLLNVGMHSLVRNRALIKDDVVTQDMGKIKRAEK